MSGGGIEAVLTEHLYRESTAAKAAHCSCGTWLLGAAIVTHRAHVAAAVLAWLDARLTEGDVRDVVAEELRTVGHRPPSRAAEVAFMEVENAAAAALSAVRGVLGGEGSC